MQFKFKHLVAMGVVSMAAVGGAQAAQLVVATDTAFVPFEFKQGDKYVGFDIDLWDAIAKELIANPRVAGKRIHHFTVLKTALFLQRHRHIEVVEIDKRLNPLSA